MWGQPSGLRLQLEVGLYYSLAIMMGDWACLSCSVIAEGGVMVLVCQWIKSQDCKICSLSRFCLCPSIFIANGAAKSNWLQPVISFRLLGNIILKWGWIYVAMSLNYFTRSKQHWSWSGSMVYLTNLNPFGESTICIHGFCNTGKERPHQQSGIVNTVWSIFIVHMDTLPDVSFKSEGTHYIFIFFQQLLRPSSTCWVRVTKKRDRSSKTEVDSPR